VSRRRDTTPLSNAMTVPGADAPGTAHDQAAGANTIGATAELVPASLNAVT
jgi:hypothetical protein